MQLLYRRAIKIEELTKEMLTHSRVIARGKHIRDLQQLMQKYGGTAKGWSKKSSPVLEVNGEFYEYHWYEHHGIGRFEIKKKML